MVCLRVNEIFHVIRGEVFTPFGFAFYPFNLFSFLIVFSDYFSLCDSRFGIIGTTRTTMMMMITGWQFSREWKVWKLSNGPHVLTDNCHG